MRRYETLIIALLCYFMYSGSDLLIGKGCAEAQVGHGDTGIKYNPSIPLNQSLTRTGRFLSLHYGKVDSKWIIEAARKVDIMILSANIQTKAPQILRKTNRKVLSLGYLNTLDFDGSDGGKHLELQTMTYEWATINNYEDWFLHDDKGNRILVYLHAGYKERYAIDRTNPNVQNYIARKAKEIVAAGYDGVFLDNFQLELLFRRKDKYSGFPAGMTNTRWQIGGVELLKAIKKAIGDGKIVIYNGLHEGWGRKLSQYQSEGISPFDSAMMMAEICDGAMWEGYFAGKLNDVTLRHAVETIAAYNKLGKITVALATGNSEDEAKLKLSLYLLSLYGEQAYFSYVPDYKHIRWYKIFDIDIGKPLGAYVLHDGCATRQFEKGIVIINLSEQNKVIRPYRFCHTLHGKGSNEISLPPKSAEILYCN